MEGEEGRTAWRGQRRRGGRGRRERRGGWQWGRERRQTARVRERAAARARAVGAAEEARGGAAAQTAAVVAREEAMGAVGAGGANAIVHTSLSRCRSHTGAVDVPSGRVMRGTRGRARGGRCHIRRSYRNICRRPSREQPWRCHSTPATHQRRPELQQRARGNSRPRPPTRRRGQVGRAGRQPPGCPREPTCSARGGPLAGGNGPRRRGRHRWRR